MHPSPAQEMEQNRLRLIVLMVSRREGDRSRLFRRGHENAVPFSPRRFLYPDARMRDRRILRQCCHPQREAKPVRKYRRAHGIVARAGAQAMVDVDEANFEAEGRRHSPQRRGERE
jgi:hypothetical protein